MSDEFGPLMQGLSEQQRGFVMAMFVNPQGTATEWAKAAGYVDNDTGAIRVRAHKLMHNEKVQEAAREYGTRFLTGTAVSMAIAVLVMDLGHPDARVRSVAANSILDRGGVSAKTEHRVVVSHSAEDMEKIALRLAGELGIEPMKLIGGNTTTPVVLDNQKVVPTEGAGQRVEQQMDIDSDSAF